MSNFPAIIPDALLAWGKTPEVAIHFQRPWASDIEALIAKGSLGIRDTRTLMARLEALCAEAVRAGRPDLLGGLDTRTAEYLGLSYAITMDDGQVVEIGRGKRFTWAEMREVLAADDPKEALKAVDRVKDLLEDAFPGVRAGEVLSDNEDPSQACGSCGTTTSQVMLATEHGTHHCGRCWLLLTDDTPVNYKKTKPRGKR